MNNSGSGKMGRHFCDHCTKRLCMCVCVLERVCEIKLCKLPPRQQVLQPIRAGSSRCPSATQKRALRG